MDDHAELLLVCHACRRVTSKPVRWIQEHTFITCPYCGATQLIDKDEATRLLTEISRKNG